MHISSSKSTVLQFLSMIARERRVREAFDLFVGPTYTQHSPQAPDGKQAMCEYLERFINDQPELIHEIRRVIAEGDLVAVHSVIKLNAADRGTAYVDIYRVEAGKLVEHWDVSQPIPSESMHRNPMA